MIDLASSEVHARLRAQAVITDSAVLTSMSRRRDGYGFCRYDRIGLAAPFANGFTPKTWAGTIPFRLASPVHLVWRYTSRLIRPNRRTNRSAIAGPSRTRRFGPDRSHTGASREAVFPSALSGRLALSGVAGSERSRFMLGTRRRCILRSFAFALAANPRPFRPDSPPWWPGPRQVRSPSRIIHRRL
jgi:hypothetical protein